MPKKRTTLSLPDGLREEAAEYKVNMSEAAEAGIIQALEKAKAEAWQTDNAQLIDDINRFNDENGMLLTEHRLFD